MVSLEPQPHSTYHQGPEPFGIKHGPFGITKGGGGTKLMGRTNRTCSRSETQLSLIHKHFTQSHPDEGQQRDIVVVEPTKENSRRSLSHFTAFWEARERQQLRQLRSKQVGEFRPFALCLH